MADVRGWARLPLRRNLAGEKGAVSSDAALGFRCALRVPNGWRDAPSAPNPSALESAPSSAAFEENSIGRMAVNDEYHAIGKPGSIFPLYVLAFQFIRYSKVCVSSLEMSFK